MRLFLDTSVLLAACGSAKGASREIFRLASAHGWALIATPYLVEEVLHNLPLLPANATSAWGHLRVALTVRDDVLTLDRAAIFPASKDRPVLFGGLAWSDVLLTLDKADFAGARRRVLRPAHPHPGRLPQPRAGCRPLARAVVATTGVAPGASPTGSAGRGARCCSAWAS